MQTELRRQDAFPFDVTTDAAVSLLQILNLISKCRSANGRASRNRIALDCERLEERDTPSTSPLNAAFGAGGKVLDSLSGAPAEFSQVLVEADGKILSAGDGVGPHGSRPVVALFNGDGTPDKSFGHSGIAIFDFDSSIGHIDAIAVQSNGKIIIAGSPATTITAQRPTFELARLNADGSLDKTFGGDGRVTASFGGDPTFNAFDTDVGLPTGVAVQADGKIVVTGAAALKSGSGFDVAIALDRFNENGTLDTSFNHTGKVVTDWGHNSAIPEALALQSDGKIDVAGTIYSGDGLSGPGFFVARYNSNGTPDSTFDGDGKVATFTHPGSGAAAAAMALQKDGRILVAGSLDDGFAVERFTAAGKVDSTFGDNGIASAPFTQGRASGVAVQADGKVLLGGTALDPVRKHPEFVLARFTTAGKLDTSFGTGGMTGDSLGVFAGTAQALALQANGNAVLAGSTAATANSAGVATLADFKTSGTTSTPTPTQKKSSTTSLTASTKSSAFGQYVTFTVTVAESGSSAKPTGTVTFKDGSTVLETVTLVNGSASLSWGHLSLGGHTITAVYGGDSNANGSTSSSLTITVSKAPLQLSGPSVSPTTPTAGSKVTISVRVGLAYSGATADPTGTITFKDGNTVLGTVPLNAHGVTQLTLSFLSAGTHHFTAVYSGDAHFLSGAFNATAVTVATPSKPSARVTLENLGNVTMANSGLMLLVTVKSASGSGTPSGWVTIMDGSTALAQIHLDSTGKAALAKGAGLPAGRHILTAVYLGDVAFPSSTGSLVLTLS